MKFADYSPCNALISFMTHCPLITLIFGIAIPLYIGYLGVVSSNYSIVVNVDFEKYLQAESKLQSMGNAYARLIQEQATIVEAPRKRGLKEAERRPVFSIIKPANLLLCLSNKAVTNQIHENHCIAHQHHSVLILLLERIGPHR